MKNKEKNLVLGSILNGNKDLPSIQKDTELDLKCIKNTLNELGIKLKRNKNVSRSHRIKVIIAKNKSHKFTIEWYEQFDDLDKLKIITNFISRDETSRDKISDEEYKKIVEHFYFDKNFNTLYDIWDKNSNKWIKPSFDHIIPYSNGGKTTLDNLRCCTWFENCVRGNVDIKDWGEIKKIIYENSDLFFDIDK